MIELKHGVGAWATRVLTNATEALLLTDARGRSSSTSFGELDQRIGWVQTSVESVGAKLGSMEAEVSKMAVAHEGLERRVVGALEQILHRVNEMERKMPRGRAGM